METLAQETDVCVVGGGPAGLVAALLLLKAGHRVTVLERHANFDREYRGEVLMPRFIQMMRALGLLSYVESQEHLKLEGLEIFYRDWNAARVKFSQAIPDTPYALWMPQPVLLAALNEKAKNFPGYTIHFGAAAVELLAQDGKVCGVRAAGQGQTLEVRAKVTVGADGRTSAVSRLGLFKHEYDQHEFDILWFSVERPKEYGRTVRGFFSPRRNYLILPKYPDLLQCGLVIRPGEFSRFMREGVDSVRREILSANSVLHPFAHSLKDFEPFSLLQARVHLVKEWARDGCVLIGDAAHTCSPAGAVGVSIAVETAILAADVIDRALRSGDISKKVLSEIQTRREKDVREIQSLQKGFARGIATFPPQFSWLAASALFILSRTPFFKGLLRRLASLSGPMEVRPLFKF